MRHSELITDLHYSKVRQFSGNPQDATPDFVGELMVQTETKQLYIATGTAAGALEAVGALAIGGDAAIQFGNGRPTNTPSKVGLTHVDLQLTYPSRPVYWAVRTNSPNGWISDRVWLDVNATFSNLSSQPSPSVFRLLYADVLATSPDPSFASSGEYPLTLGSPVSFGSGYGAFNFALGGAIAFGFDLDPSVKVLISGSGLGGQMQVYQSTDEILDPVSGSSLGNDFLFFNLDSYPYPETINLRVDLVDR